MSLGDTDMIELPNKLWRWPINSQHTNMLPVTPVISKSQFTFWMKVCFVLIIHFSMIYATTWYFLKVNSPLNNYTFIPHILAQVSNIHTASSHIVFPPRFYFFNLVPILCTSIIPIHETYFFPNMVLNTIIKFKTNLSILSNTITKFILPNCHARKTSTTQVRFTVTIYSSYSAFSFLF